MTSTSIYTSAIPVAQSKTEIFISKAKLVHGETYNYDFVEYIHSKQNVNIECKIHGIFEQRPNNHLSGYGCIICNKNLLSKTEEYIEKAKKIHGNLYDYTHVNYINVKTDIIIECKTHGITKQKPKYHLEGIGCTLCGRVSSAKLHTISTYDFIQRAKLIHGDLYNYELVDYKHSQTKLKIECKMHGIFEQSPHSHLSGYGCSQCNKRISNIETKWLESLNISNMILEYRLPEHKYKPVDGYDPLTNTIYQFHGDYWHGNPSKFADADIHPVIKLSYGDLYRKTIESDTWIRSLGYKLVTMWESDYKLL